GAITGVQLGAAMNFIIRDSAFLISGGIVLGLVREMIPVLTAMVVVSRMCSSVTAEIGSMVVTEQIDALRVMSIDPEEYVALPRIITGLITVPIMGSIAIALGILGASFSMSVLYKVSPHSFFSSGLDILLLRFYLEALLKLALFGFLLLLIATFYGFRTTGGSVGVGTATVKSVVVGTVVTILLDYVAGTFFLMY
ncbi:MAG: MlaE family ABC transporter permease, partial [Brevinema sp.]